MEIILAPAALEDLEYWKRINNAAILKRIELLLADIAEHPFTGIGRPELLKFDLAGKWSRRINSEHRIVYKVTPQGIEVLVLSMRHHYKN